MLNNEIFSIINDLKNNESNLNRCFECSMLNPNYIWKDYGIFICFVCANIHKRNKSNLIEIKSDNTYELKSAFDYLFCGGNKKFQEFLEIYELKETPIGDENLHSNEMFLGKYKTHAAVFYKNKLENEVKGNISEDDVIPGFEEGRKVMENENKFDENVEKSLMCSSYLDQM